MFVTLAVQPPQCPLEVVNLISHPEFSFEVFTHVPQCLYPISRGTLQRGHKIHVGWENFAIFD